MKLFSFILVSSLFCHLSAFAGPKFKTYPSVIQVEAESELTYDLKNLLSQTGSGTLIWAVFGQTPSFLTFDAQAGTFLLKPHDSDAGTHSFSLSVKEAETDEGDISPLNVVVRPKPKPPVWAQVPTLEVIESQPLAFDLSGYVTDPNQPAQLPIHFRRDLSTPSWLQLSDGGALSGVPQAADVGETHFQVLAQNNLGLVSSGNLTVRVVGLFSEEWDFSSLLGAKSEMTWVLDYSNDTDWLISNIKRRMVFFFDELKKWKVEHTAVVVSDDVYWHKALPLAGKNGSLTMTWDQSYDLPTDFADRAWAGFVLDHVGSPIWGYFNFLKTIPTVSDIYHRGFMERYVPMDTILVTERTDGYGWWAEKTPYEHYNDQDYAENFKKFHEGEEKPFRVHAFGYESPKPFGVNHMRPICEATGGTFFGITAFYNFEAKLRELARGIGLRAKVFAHRKLKLTKTPKDTRLISVFLDGKGLNVGTQWTYDSTKNEITLVWEKIDTSQITPTTKIRVKYPAL